MKIHATTFGLLLFHLVQHVIGFLNPTVAVVPFRRRSQRPRPDCDLIEGRGRGYRGLCIQNALPENYKECGEALIREAGVECGAKEDQLDIEWKGDRIIVTVHGEVFVSDPSRADDIDEFPIDDGDDSLLQDEMDLGSPVVPSSNGLDVAELARAINRKLDDGGTGLAIAKTHEIEVTTPGASDELVGVMFESYKGFDVMCRFVDKKAKKEKTIEGRLVEKGEDVLVINIKGRMKKIKNEDVLSVKLPKAKKEKGVR